MFQPGTNTPKYLRGLDDFSAAEMELASMHLSEALASFDIAEAAGVDPDRCAAGRWECHMLAGNFQQAWEESDRINSRGGIDPHRFWDGEPIDGKHVLIRCLHGLGDTLQFVRFCPSIRKKAKSLVIEAQPKLKELLQISRLADDVIMWGETEPFWDQQLEINELPRIFRTTVASIPNSVPYLRAPSAVMASCDGRHPLRVGLVWKAGDFNPSRSIPLALWADLLSTSAAKFFSLQGEPDQETLSASGGRLVHLDEGSRGLLATADHVASMDLVITVDTMMAHLAGALARPVWTLIPYRCDWRWMANRTDTPWYPTMRLFRQSRAGDWAGVMERVHRELTTFLAARSWKG